MVSWINEWMNIEENEWVNIWWFRGVFADRLWEALQSTGVTCTSGPGFVCLFVFCFVLLHHFVQSLSGVWPFVIPWTAAHQASLPFTISQSLLKLTSIESVIPSNHLILCRPTFCSCPQSFPASGSFPMNWLFPSGGQSIGALGLFSIFMLQ